MATEGGFVMGNYERSTIQKSRIRSAIQGMLCEMEPNYFVTANFNRETTFEGARKCLRRWHALVDKKRLGKDWSKKPSADRVFFFAFSEHPDDNLHYHLILRAPQLLDRPSFDTVGPKVWERLVQGGDLYVQKLKTKLDVAKVSSYSTKDLWNERLFEQWIVSSEFMT